MGITMLSHRFVVNSSKCGGTALLTPEKSINSL
jgi:hypothetical protein